MIETKIYFSQFHTQYSEHPVSIQVNTAWETIIKLENVSENCCEKWENGGENFPAKERFRGNDNSWNFANFKFQQSNPITCSQFMKLKSLYKVQTIFNSRKNKVSVIKRQIAKL